MPNCRTEAVASQSDIKELPMQSYSPMEMLGTLTTRAGAIGGTAALMVLGLVASAGSQTVAPATGSMAEATAAQPPAEVAQVFSAEQRKAIEAIVKDYLLKHPEILVEVSKELEKRQSAEQAAEHKRVISEKRKAIFSARSDFVLGNPKGDITVVEFFDYNCAWCKRAVDEMSKLTKADPNVRIVFKEFPIFGENSTFAAKAAMASIKQGKYWDFHVALMKERQVTKDNVFKIAEKVGLDVARLKADMADPGFDAAIKETTELAQALGIEGTPGFIIDTKVNVGFLPADGLRQMIAEIRKAGCEVC
jgi:protein-disulfide isomerase